MSNAHYARPERAWANIPVIAETTDAELAELESEPEDPMPRQRRDTPHLIRIRKPNGQIAPTPIDLPLRGLFQRCADQYGITVDQLRGRSNARHVVRARWLAMMVLTRTGMSLPQIARAIGAGKHHTTVMYGLDAANYALKQDAHFAQAWANVSGKEVEIPQVAELWRQPLNKIANLRAIQYNQNVLNAKLDEILRRLPTCASSNRYE